MSLRITSVSAFVAAPVFVAALLAGGCGGNGNTDVGMGGNPASGTGGQSSICSQDKTAMPFSDGMHQTTGDVTVAISPNPPLPTLGDHSTWTLTVTDSSNMPLTGKDVSVVCKMTHSTYAHGCPANISVKEIG